jgi:hypothetical protein
MARPKIMEDMKVTSHALDKSDLVIIEKERGKLTASAYLRLLIRGTQKEEGERSEIKTLQRELQETKMRLEAFERKERNVSQEHKDIIQDIADNFTGYMDMYPNASQREQQNWLSGRCLHQPGISPADIIALKGSD